MYAYSCVKELSVVNFIHCLTKFLGRSHNILETVEKNFKLGMMRIIREINVWAGIVEFHIIEPFFTRNNLDGNIYLQLGIIKSYYSSCPWCI